MGVACVGRRTRTVSTRLRWLQWRRARAQQRWNGQAGVGPGTSKFVCSTLIRPLIRRGRQSQSLLHAMVVRVQQCTSFTKPGAHPLVQGRPTIWGEELSYRLTNTKSGQAHPRGS